MPLDSVLDTPAGPDGAAGLGPDPGADKIRHRSFDVMMTNVEDIPALVGRLGRIAGRSFDHFDTAGLVWRPS